MAKVLIVATSHRTRGGVTSVIKAHKSGRQWNEYHCRWIETHRDGNLLTKLLYVIHAFLQYLFLLPFYDLVHIHIGEPPSALRKQAFMWWAKTWHKKTIVHFHSFSPRTTIKSKYSYLYHYLFTHADKVIVLSEYWKKEVDATFPEAHTVVVYNPCPAVKGTSEQETTKSVCPFAHSILFAGTVSQRKGYPDLIHAFAKIAEQHRDWGLIFAGNGEVEKGKSIAQETGISDQVLWLGWVNGKAKDAVFRHANIFCLPSYAEGFPMGVLDAWAYGLPVVTTPVGGIPDIADDGENILLFNPGDIDALACQLNKMINDNTLRNNIAKESIILAQTTFNIETINGQIENLYKELTTK